MPIFDKPTKILMRQFAGEQLKSGQVFQKKLVVDWFKRNYPKIKPVTVQMHVEAMAVNSPFRRHHANVRAGSGHDLFFRVVPGRFRLWDPASDPAPGYGDQLLAEGAGAEIAGEVEDKEELQEEVAAREFAFERDLRNYLAKNLPALEARLALYKDEDITGRISGWRALHRYPRCRWARRVCRYGAEGFTRL